MSHSKPVWVAEKTFEMWVNSIDPNKLWLKAEIVDRHAEANLVQIHKQANTFKQLMENHTSQKNCCWKFLLQVKQLDLCWQITYTGWRWQTYSWSVVDNWSVLWRGRKHKKQI